MLNTPEPQLKGFTEGQMRQYAEDSVSHHTESILRTLSAAVDEIRELRQAMEQLQKQKAVLDQIRHDAANWGSALNSAGWEFLDGFEEMTGEVANASVFNSCKTLVRSVILDYIKQCEQEVYSEE